MGIDSAVELELETWIPATRERVWKILTDHENMVEWFPAREVVRRRAGSPDPDGVGAIRVVRSHGLAVEERITAFKAGERLDYAVSAGAPFRDHDACVVLASEDGGTRVRWSVRLTPRFPATGRLIARLVRRQLDEALCGLRARASGGPDR